MQTNYLANEMIFFLNYLFMCYHRLAQNRCYDVGKRKYFLEAIERDYWHETGQKMVDKPTQLTFIYSNSTKETLEKCVKHVQS